MDRTLIRLSGPDAPGFLDGLITNQVPGPGDGLRYAALLTPQGKYIADFFVLAEEDGLLIDVAASHAALLAQRLTMYRLRAAVEIAEDPRLVSTGPGRTPRDALTDPRHPELGWRRYGPSAMPDTTDRTAIRVAHCIPETGIELTPDSYILEAGFDRLNGVDFTKGCFVGQEIVARMKHKTELRKGLATVNCDGQAPVGTEITSAGKPVGTLFSQSGGQAIAYLRFDRATGPLTAGTASLTYPG